jgi:hypothetical protein
MSYQTWLEDTAAKRCVLVEATINKLTSDAVGTDTVSIGIVTLYYSSSGYITTNSDVYYQPIVLGGLKFNESLSTDGTISITYGDIELHNYSGTYDKYLDNTKYIWVNGSIKIYYGDPTWVCANHAEIVNGTASSFFELIFDGTIADIDSRDRNVLNIKVRDKLQRLNTPITETKLGYTGVWGSGNQTNYDSIIPIVFGEVFNVSPMYRDPSILEYIVNNGNTEDLIEVRDNGVPVYTDGVWANGSGSWASNTGIFTLANPLVGTITCDVQGQKQKILFNADRVSVPTLIAGTYDNNIAGIVALIVTQFGNIDTKLALSELDPANFYDFYINNTQPIGVFITDRENTLDICNQIVNSLGAQLFFTRKGKLQLLKLGVSIPTGTVARVNITTTDIVANTFYISNRTAVIAATKLGYCKNYTIQSDLVTAIPQAHKDSYALDWLSETVVDVTIKNNYKLNADPIQKDTVLVTIAGASIEATRLNNYFKYVRTTYKFTGTSKLLSLQLGQEVSLAFPRFGLDAGVVGQVISLGPDWSKGLVEVEVLI